MEQLSKVCWLCDDLFFPLYFDVFRRQVESESAVMNKNDILEYMRHDVSDFAMHTGVCM